MLYYPRRAVASPGFFLADVQNSEAAPYQIERDDDSSDEIGIMPNVVIGAQYPGEQNCDKTEIEQGLGAVELCLDHKYGVLHRSVIPNQADVDKSTRGGEEERREHISVVSVQRCYRNVDHNKTAEAHRCGGEIFDKFLETKLYGLAYKIAGSQLIHEPSERNGEKIAAPLDKVGDLRGICSAAHTDCQPKRTGHADEGCEKEIFASLFI